MAQIERRVITAKLPLSDDNRENSGECTAHLTEHIDA